VPTLERLKTELKYEFREISRGALVRITTANKEALAALHEFLKFQIDDHRTGDAKRVTN